MTFQNLSPEITRALADNGIMEPTDPQKDAIPKILAKENVLLVAPTGIGKTEAAMVPILESIFRTKEKKGIRCLYITPLRALNRDMLKRMEGYGEKLGVSVGVRHGDTPQSERNKQSLNPPQIMITTPETLQVLFTGKRLLQHLKNVEWVVIDEIHELATVERGAQLSVALERLVYVAGEYQRIGLSATVGNVEEVAHFLAGTNRNVTICKHDTHRDFDIKVVCPKPSDDSVLLDKLQCEPYILAVMKEAKKMIENGKSTLFFVNTRETAEWLAARYHLMDEKLSIDVHHGSLSKENRMDMEDQFKRGDIKALVCTSSLELGIDVGSTDLVIQYNSPRQISRMVQRAGRAGHRIGEKIRAKIIATSPDEVTESLVVARRTDAKELENKTARPAPLSVVANQLIAMTMTSRVTRDVAFSIFKKSHVFKDMDRIEMDEVIEQLKSIKMIFEDEDGFRRSKKGMNYFFDNISMIPDEKTYVIRDISSRGIIGTLDESFVLSFAEPYAMFIAKGHTWQIVEMLEDELLVQETGDIGSVPSWTGSDIPVPYEVAMEVGKLRRTLNLDDYPGDENSKECVRKFVAEQRGYTLPTDQTMTIEFGDKLIVINACFGTRVNETLGKIYSSMIMARLGQSVGMSTDPYRIMLELPDDVDEESVVESIKSIEPGTAEDIIRFTIANSTFLKWRFVYVAKKFGIIEKDADHRFMNFNKLFDMHKNTPVYKEAVNKVMWEDLDIPNTDHVIRLIHYGKIKIVTSKLSPIGMEGITRSKELMQPHRADHSILMALKKRLENEVLYATCMNCRRQWRVRVSAAPKVFVCEKCGGRVIGLLKEYEKDSVKLLEKTNLTKEEKRMATKIFRSADIVNGNGQRASLTLAARGVGPEVASRILRRSYIDEDDFLREILAAEVLYARNKRFWD